MNVLNEASDIAKRKWRNTHSAWKAALLVGLVILAILAIIGLALWLVGRLITSLTAGGFRNTDLYLPRVKRW